MFTDSDKTTKTIDEPHITKFVIPECCIEGWDTCIHVKKPETKREINPAF